MISSLFSSWYDSLNQFSIKELVPMLKTASRDGKEKFSSMLRRFWWLLSLDLGLIYFLGLSCKESLINFQNKQLSSGSLLNALLFIFFIVLSSWNDVLIFLFAINSKSFYTKAELSTRIKDYLKLVCIILISFSILGSIFKVMCTKFGIEMPSSFPKYFYIMLSFAVTVFSIRWLDSRTEKTKLLTLFEQAINDFFYQAPYFFVLGGIFVAIQYAFETIFYMIPREPFSLKACIATLSKCSSSDLPYFLITFRIMSLLGSFCHASFMRTWFEKNKYLRYTRYFFQPND